MADCDKRDTIFIIWSINRLDWLELDWEFSVFLGTSPRIENCFSQKESIQR